MDCTGRKKKLPVGIESLNSCDKTLFDGLDILKEKSLCETYMGKFPVIAISLKGVEANNYETARNLAVKVINREARRQMQRDITWISVWQCGCLLPLGCYQLLLRERR